MALEKSLNTPSGFVCEKGYAVIAEASFIKDSNAQGKLVFFKDQQAKENGYESILTWNFAFNYDMDSDLNIVRQAYDAVRKNIDYLDAVDV